MMYEWHDRTWGVGAWIGMGLMMVVFWAMVTALVVYVVRSLGRRDEPERTARADQPLRILDERFARGEIDADEYTRRRSLLRGP